MAGVTVTASRTVDLDGLFAAAMGRFLTRVMLAGHKAASDAAPVDTGLLRASLAPGGGATMVDPGSPPRWAAVGSNLHRYPGALNKYDRFHYRAGPHAGNTTKGWLSDIQNTVQPDVKAALADMGHELAEGWRRG